MTSSQFHCPFCQQTSPRPQGLAAHIRNRHPKQYPKWLKTPSRLVDAQKGAIAPDAPEAAGQVAEPETAVQPQAVKVAARVSSPRSVEASPALDLLNKAHTQLIERKRSIEAEIAHLSDLTKELETVNTQIQALDKALGAF